MSFNSQKSVCIKRFYMGVIEELFNKGLITEEEKFECIKRIPKYTIIKGDKYEKQ